MSLPDFYTNPFPCFAINENYDLREHQIEDAAAFLRYYNDAKVSQFNIAAPIPSSLAEAKEETSYCRNLFYEHKGIYWALAQRDNDTMIGAIGIHMRTPTNHGEIHYDLDQHYWNRGIMTHALYLVLQFCFTGGSFASMEARTLKANMASIKVLEKLGFSHHHTENNYQSYNGQKYDIEVYQATPESFQCCTKQNNYPS